MFYAPCENVGSLCILDKRAVLRAERRTAFRTPMGLEADCMLALMRADTVPNAEILLAKGMDDFRLIAKKYQVVLPDPSALAAAPSAEAVSEDESSETSGSAGRFNDMRRWTKPPSYYEARTPTAPLSRRRRRELMPMDSSDDSSSSFGSRFGPEPSGGGGSGDGGWSFSPHAP
jgi:hypothetical protein